MTRIRLLALLALTVATSATFAQDMATRRAIRTIRAQEKELLDRITQRVEWDKRLTGSTIEIDVQPGGAVFLKGSVPTDEAKTDAVILVENTTGVARVTDELAVTRSTKVYDAGSTGISATPARQPVLAPSMSRIIAKP